MSQRNINILFVMFGVIIFVIFISGCAKVPDKSLAERTSNSEQPTVSGADQRIIISLMNRLNSVVNNYEASYKKVHEVSSCAWGSPGATSYEEESYISIEVSDGQITNYTLRYTKEGVRVEKEDYFMYYDKSQNKLCKEQIVSESNCTLITLIPPKLGGILTGCKYDDFKPEDLPTCSEEKNTSNMILKDGYAIYYPETKKGFCYYEAMDNTTKEWWVFECDQKNIKLEPIITNNLEPLSNIKCEQHAQKYTFKYTRYVETCTCTFDPVKTLVCSEDEPNNNVDSDVKQEIIDYLKYVTISSISEQDNEYGHCYSFIYGKLRQIFCFNEQNLITFAQWGKNITDSPEGEFVNINKIEMI